MKLYYYIRMMLRAIFTQFPLLFLTYVIFPFGLAYFMSASMGGILEPSIEDPNIEVHVRDLDESELSAAAVDTIQGEALAPLFDFQEEDDAEYLVTIPEGFGAGLINGKGNPIEIEGKNAASRNSGRVLQQVFSKLTEELAKEDYMITLFNQATLPQEDLAAVQAEVMQIQQANFIQEEEHVSDTMLSSQEYFAVVIVTYLIIMFLSAGVSAEGMAESVGFEKRWRAAPLTKWQAWGMEVLGNVVQFFIFLALYVLLWRAVGGIFNQNPVYLLLILFLHAIIASLLNSFITHTFSAAVGKIIVNFSLFFVLIFGGMLGPLERTTNWAIFEKLNSETVTYFITNPYWTLMKQNDWQSLSGLIIQLVLIVSVLTFLNMLSVHFRKKVFR